MRLAKPPACCHGGTGEDEGAEWAAGTGDLKRNESDLEIENRP
jgi:hypothetical protein